MKNMKVYIPVFDLRTLIRRKYTINYINTKLNVTFVWEIMPGGLAKPEYRRKVGKFLPAYTALCSRKQCASNFESSN